MENKSLKIALVHDFLVQWGGAERVLKVLSDMYPEAPIYTLLYDKEKMKGMFEGKDIRPSYLQKFPKFLRKKYWLLAPFYPVVPETLDLRDFDLVISSSGAWTKGIVTNLNTTHVAYIHSPMRFVWDYNERYLKEKNKKPSLLTRIALNYLRMWDRLAADRPDYLIANSKYTQRRVEKYYRRESEVIYPPVDIKSEIRNPKSETNSKSEILNSKPAQYFLTVSRLNANKKVDVIVEAFNKLELPLVVIGEGQQEKYLRKIANDNIQFLGWQSDEIVQSYFENSQGFVFAAEDDFGMTMVEAMSFGIPVIAYRKGGALEIVEEGITGEFFDAQTPEVLADAVRRFMLNEKKYAREVIIKKAGEFSRERFEKEFTIFMGGVMQNSNCKMQNN